MKTGFLGGNNVINLSQKGVHGCTINILLTQNANALGPYDVILADGNGNGGQVSTPVAASATGFQYQLSNVFLSYDVYVPNDSVYNSMPSSGQISFNTINSMNSTLISSDQTLTMRTGLKNLISVTHSMIPAVFTNNISQDSLALTRPSTNTTAAAFGTGVPVNTVQYFKGGSLFPFNSVLDSESQSIVNPQSMIIQPALNSVTLFENDHMMLSPQTSVSLNNASGFAGLQQKGLTRNQVPDPNSDFILGTAFDTAQQGVDYSMQDYAIRINSGLNGGTPYQFFSFFRARNVLNFSPMGIDVIE